MKNNSKRILALLLAIVMCVSCVVPVFAEVDVHDHAEESTTELVDKTECQHAIDEKGTHVYVEGAEHLIHVGTEAPKCDAPGYDIYKCAACGTPVLNTKSENFVPGEHVFGEWETVTELTCEQDGSYKRTCTKCDKTETKTEKAQGHQWSDPKVNTDENGNQYVCGDENAYATKTCSVCNATEKVELGDECDFSGRPEFIPGPTCTEAGKAIYTCANCGNTKTVEVLPIDPANGHTWVLKGDYVSAPTCSQNGKGYAVCAVCGIDYVNAETENIFEFVGTKIDEGHNFVDVDAKAPTCTVDGYEAHKACEYCGKPETAIVVIPATGHLDANLTYVPATKADCENDAMAAHYTCACGAYLDANKVETTKDALITEKAWGHDFTAEEPTVSEPATCTKYGYELYCCTKCGKLAKIGDSQGVVMLDPLKHTNPDGTSAYVEHFNGTADCENGTTAYRECTLCGDKTEEYDVPALEHELEEEFVEATCSKPAYTKVTCSRCEYKTEKDVGTELDPDNHNIQIVIHSHATCGEIEGRLEYCENCNYRKDIFITVEHNWQLDEEASVAPTCYATGTNVYTCDICNGSKSETLDKVDHVWPTTSDAENVVYTKPVCGNDGYFTLTCTNDGCTETKKVDGEKYNALNPAHHANGKPAVVCNVPSHKNYSGIDVAPGTEECTCVANSVEDTIYREGNCNIVGLQQYECECGARYYVEIEGTGPAVDENGNKVHYGKEITTEAKAPTCTEDGCTEGWTCSSCGESAESETISKINHANKVLVEAKADTCTEAGWLEHYSCPDCEKLFVLDGENLVEKTMDELVVDEIQHKFVKHDEIPATCAANGTKEYYTCEICECDFFMTLYGYIKILNPIELVIRQNNNHHYNRDIIYVTPDCINEGFVYNYCPTCGDEYIDCFQYALGHTYDKQDKVDATCDTEGTEEHYTCDRCDLKFQIVDDEYVVVTDEDLVIPVLGYHQNAEGKTFYDKCTDKTEDKFCVWCEKDYAGKGHNYIENVVAPTCQNDGYTVQICQFCGEHTAADADIEKATNPGHKDESKLERVTVEADVLTPGKVTYTCPSCKQVIKTEDIAAKKGIKFTYNVENAIKPGAEFVNGGQIKLTIYFEAIDVTLASVALALNYDAELLEFVKGGIICDAKAADGSNVFNAGSWTYGGDEPGFVVILADTYAAGEKPSNKVLNSDHDLTTNDVFAEIYFNINRDYVKDSSFGFTVNEDESMILEAVNGATDVTFDTVEANFGEGTEKFDIALLGDINGDGKYDNADKSEFLAIAHDDKDVANKSDENPDGEVTYLAIADINQDGRIGLDDYKALLNRVSHSGTDEDLWAEAQK